MAYCRMGSDSDVYLYHSTSGGWLCCMCGLLNTSYTFKTRLKAYKHLLKHRKNNHKVPQDALDRLLEEMGKSALEVAMVRVCKRKKS